MQYYENYKNVIACYIQKEERQKNGILERIIEQIREKNYNNARTLACEQYLRICSEIDVYNSSLLSMYNVSQFISGKMEARSKKKTLDRTLISGCSCLRDLIFLHLLYKNLIIFRMEVDENIRNTVTILLKWVGEDWFNEAEATELYEKEQAIINSMFHFDSLNEEHKQAAIIDILKKDLLQKKNLKLTDETCKLMFPGHSGRGGMPYRKEYQQECYNPNNNIISPQNRIMESIPICPSVSISMWSCTQSPVVDNVPFSQCNITDPVLNLEENISISEKENEENNTKIETAKSSLSIEGSKMLDIPDPFQVPQPYTTSNVPNDIFVPTTKKDKEVVEEKQVSITKENEYPDDIKKIIELAKDTPADKLILPDRPVWRD